MVQHSHLFPTFTHYTLPTPKPHGQTNMKFILFASIISFAVAAAVGSADTNIDVSNNIISSNIYSNNFNYSPYRRTLSKDDCNDIVNAFISILQNKRYKNQPPSSTYKKYLARNFGERSGSINSLISPANDVNSPSHPIASLTQQSTNKPLQVNANVLNDRDTWFRGVQQNPVKNIKASKIYVADGNKCLWQWKFGSVGSGRYDVHGFNLFYISDNKKEIAGVDIEFNSLAWGFNTGQVNQYCPK
jgi:hypothetical protein